MKVYILTEGGKKIGFGHVTRCSALYQALTAQKIKPELLINGDNTLKFALRSKQFRIFDWLSVKNTTYGILKTADAVIIDSYLAGPKFYHKVSTLVKTPVFIDDNRRLKYPDGIILNGSVYAGSLKYPIRRGLKYLLGCKYMPLRREFWASSKPILRREIRNVVVSFGGMDRRDLIHDFNVLLENKFGYKVTIVSANKKILNTDKMRELMLSNDLFISGGGQTTYELARCGTPAIGICFAGNQLRNLQGWAKKGSLYFAGWYNDRSLLGKIEQILPELNYHQRLEMSAAGRRLIDGQGAARVVRAMLNYQRSRDI